MYRRTFNPELQARQRSAEANRIKQVLARANRGGLDNENDFQVSENAHGSMIVRAFKSIISNVRSFFGLYPSEDRLIWARRIAQEAWLKRQQQHRNPRRRRMRKLMRARKAVQRHPCSNASRARLARCMRLAHKGKVIKSTNQSIVLRIEGQPRP